MNYSQSSIRILDYGGASGLIAHDLALRLIECGHINEADILVVDYENDLCIPRNPNIRIRSAIPSFDQWRSLKYDLVLANDVIEHIFHVKITIEDILNCVEDKGFLCIKVPYILPLYKFLRKLGLNSLPLIVFPEHCHDYSKYFFEKFFDTFKAPEFRTIVSEPSFFAQRLKDNFLSALAARIVRSPYNICKDYPFVGGWQIIAQRQSEFVGNNI